MTWTARPWAAWSALAVLLAMAAASSQAVAADRCELSAIVTGYKDGLAAFTGGKFTQAYTAWSPLADAGLGPAQRQLAIMHAEGKGVAKSAIDAALWAELAFRSGDRRANRLSRELRAALDPASRGALDQRLGVWRTAGLVCDGARYTAEAKAADAPLEFAIEFERRVTEDAQETARRQLPEWIQSALDQDPFARIYLSVIKTFEFHTGGQYHRYIGWHPKERDVMRVATNVSMDDSVQFAARAILLQAKRRVYESLPESPFNDPLMRVIGGKKVFGSVYPDVKNTNYFQEMRRAFDMIERLPREVRLFVDIVDEIHYGPISKHYKPEGTIDAQGAYYNKILSAEGHRIIFVRRDILYSSPLYLVQTLVHEGTHAAQDQKAYRTLVEIDKLKAEQRRLAAGGQGNAAEIKQIEAKIGKLLDYPKRWFQGLETATGRIQDMAFECEATEVEIAAVKAVGGLPEVMEASGYIKLCPNAQRMIVAWQEELTRAQRGGK